MQAKWKGMTPFILHENVAAGSHNRQSTKIKATNVMGVHLSKQNWQT